VRVGQDHAVFADDDARARGIVTRDADDRGRDALHDADHGLFVRAEGGGRRARLRIDRARRARCALPAAAGDEPLPDADPDPQGQRRSDHSCGTHHRLTSPVALSWVPRLPRAGAARSMRVA
jgi:hypothetical protein